MNLTEREFLDKLCYHFMRLDDDWAFGEEIDDDVKEIMELCKRWYEERYDRRNSAGIRESS